MFLRIHYKITLLILLGLFLSSCADDSSTNSADGDSIAPTTPMNFLGSAISSEIIRLSWDSATDNIAVIGYKIYRDSVEVDQVDTTTYTSKQLVDNTTYQFQVSAVDAMGNSSDITEAITISTKAFPGCNQQSGLSGPLQVCSASEPCDRPGLELGVTEILTPTEIPVCETTETGRPVFDDGPPSQWVDANGITRYACHFSPTGAALDSQRPLVIFMHGGGIGMASTVYDFTSLRSKSESYDLTGDPSRPGFHLISVQGRNLHYLTDTDRDGHHHDFYYRPTSEPTLNPDIANIDRLIDELVESGTVDRNRIHLMGWSNGGFFSQMYGSIRHSTTTSGNNKVASVAVFTAADPFHNINATQSPSCALDPYPQSTLPTYIMSRACDVVACDSAQAAGLELEGQDIEPGHIVGDWLNDVLSKTGNTNVISELVSGTGNIATQCTAPTFCTLQIAILNHVRWPDGVADNSGIDHEPTMLNFLKANPLP